MQLKSHVNKLIHVISHGGDDNLNGQVVKWTKFSASYYERFVEGNPKCLSILIQFKRQVLMKGMWTPEFEWRKKQNS